MILLDAYAVLAALSGEAAAERVRQLLTGDEPCRMSAVGVVEVLDRLIRIAGLEPDVAVLGLAELRLLEPAPLHGVVARRAGLLRAAHYDRRTRSVSLADCVLAATAQTSSGSVATADPHLLELCHAEGIEVVALPGSSGATWSPAPGQ